MNGLISSLKEPLGLLYADDFKLLKLLQTEEDWENLQEDLNYIISWSESK